MTEGSCDSSTSRDTMIVATANVRTLHPKEEKQSRSRFGGTTMLGKVELLEIAMHDTATDVVGNAGVEVSTSWNTPWSLLPQVLRRSLQQRQCRLPIVGHSIVAETPGGHWASSEAWTPVVLCCYPSDLRRETNILDTDWAAMKKLKTIVTQNCLHRWERTNEH